MAMKRTTVFADEEDLALLREAARRRGVVEAELIREGIHLAALSNRQWSEPFFAQGCDPQHEHRSYDSALDEMRDQHADAYEQTRVRP